MCYPAEFGRSILSR